MAHQALARKYRPQAFDDLIGQPHVTATLVRALESKRLAQAYLFTGQRGVGKTSAARILAKCLNCEKGPTAKPCGRCASCTQIAQGNSLDVIEIDGASNRGIDEIRNLRESVPFAPTSGSFRVYIIDEVHMLTLEAFNALLKTLEEPPAHVKFLFATTAVYKVPPTILSRCQRFDFRRIEAATVVEVLKRVAKAEQIQADEPALYAVARACEGSLRDAEVVLEQLSSFVKGEVHEADVTELLGTVESEALIAWAQAILDHNPTEALLALNRQMRQGREPVQLLTGLLHHFRNLLIVRAMGESASQGEGLTRLLDEPPERLKRLEAQAQGSTTQELLLLLQVLAGGYELIRRSAMGQTILELLLIKLATREAWQSLDEISRRLEQMSGGPVGPVARPAPSVAPVASARPSIAPREAPASLSTGEPLARDAAPAQATLRTPEAVAAIWPAFLDRLGAQKMSLAAYLADAQPVALEEGVLTVGLPAFALHLEVLGLAENRRLIDRILSELSQRAITVEYATLPESAAPAAQSAAASAAREDMPPVVRDIVDLFNATIVTKPRPS